MKPQPRQSSWLCPACGSMMYEARLLKGYPNTGRESKRLTCALHGPRGRFHHIATDRLTAVSRRPRAKAK